MKKINPKHKPHIVAVSCSHFENRKDGLCDYELDVGDIVLARRHELEQSFDYRQILPQTVFTFKGKVWAFMRTEKGGEPGLHNNISVMVGGHWDFADIILDELGAIDLEKSLKFAIEREIKEEVTINASVVSTRVLKKVIAADETDVDKRHVAMVTIVELDNDSVESNEDELETLGFLSPEELLSGDYNLETWAKMACNILIDEKNK